MKSLYEFLFGPVLHVVDEEDHMHPSLAGVDHLEEGRVCSWGRIYGVGGEPEVLFALVDHLPNSFEELVAIDNEI